MTDYRVKVLVEFTVDVGVVDDKKIFTAVDIAEDMTRKIFHQSFSRAHLLKVETEELMVLKYET